MGLFVPADAPDQLNVTVSSGKAVDGLTLTDEGAYGAVKGSV